MGRSRYKFHEEHYPYFISSSIVDGLPLFSIPCIAQVILDALIFLQNERQVKVFAYVIMENHVHLIAQGDEISKKLRLTKSFTATEIIRVLQETGRIRILEQLAWGKLKHKKDKYHQFWQEGLHPKQLTTVEMVNQKIEYIHQNPIKRGYVDIPEHWRYSSARNYSGGEGLIPITLFEG